MKCALIARGRGWQSGRDRFDSPAIAMMDSIRSGSFKQLRRFSPEGIRPSGQLRTCGKSAVQK